MAINSVAYPVVLDLTHRHGLRQVGRLSAANANIHTANGYPATMGAQRARCTTLISTDPIPAIRNTRKTGRSAVNRTSDPCPPAQFTWRNHEQLSKPAKSEVFF